MSVISREEFLKIYEEKFVPILSKLEPERIESLKKRNKVMSILIPTLIIGLVVLCFLFQIKEISDIIILLVVAFFIALYINSIFIIKIKEKLKDKIIPKILSIYGNLYRSTKEDVISLREIQSTGLFPRAAWQTTDDVIIGVDKGCNFVISESTLEHSEGSGKHRHTVTDFQGLVVKIQMKKKFTGKTAVGEKGRVAKLQGFDKVELESVDFMKSREVVSTDQIEARYLLTTAFIERLEKLYDDFCKERSIAADKTDSIALTTPDGSIVSASFCNGYVYLFIPSFENFFEIEVKKNLLNPNNYYKIYCELQSILSVIDYLNLNSHTGL